VLGSLGVTVDSTVLESAPHRYKNSTTQPELKKKLGNLPKKNMCFERNKHAPSNPCCNDKKLKKTF